MKKEKEIEEKPSKWLDFKEAAAEAREIVATIVLTIVINLTSIETYVIEVHGIDQMVYLVKELDRMVNKKKIRKYNINNMANFPPIDFDTIKSKLKGI